MTTATASKVTKVEGMETIISTPTSSHTGGVAQQQQVQQQQQIENGNETQLLTSTPIIKSEVTKVETIVSMDPNPSADGGTVAPTTTPSKPGKRQKNTNSGESE